MAITDHFSQYQQSRGFSPRTIARRRTAIEGFCRFIRPGGLEGADGRDVEEWLLTKATAKTRHAYRSDLKLFYRWAVRRAGYPTNPVDDTDPIKVPKALPRPIGPSVFGALVAGPMRTRRMVGLGLFAGLRCSEIAALDASDIWTHQDPPIVVVRNGKGGRDRAVPLHPVLERLLDGTPRSGPIFPGLYGGHVTGGSVSALLSRHFKRCGVNATAHQLRHSFGTELARRAGGDLLLVATMMGHESMNTTRTYAAFSGESAGVIASMFDPAA